MAGDRPARGGGVTRTWKGIFFGFNMGVALSGEAIDWRFGGFLLVSLLFLWSLLYEHETKKREAAA